MSAFPMRRWNLKFENEYAMKELLFLHTMFEDKGEAEVEQEYAVYNNA